MNRWPLIMGIIGIMLSLAISLEANEYMPLGLGNWWEYDGVEVDSDGVSIPGTEYATVSTIVGDTLIGGMTFFIMQDSSNESGSWEMIERSYVRTVADTVEFAMAFFDDSTLMEVTMAIMPGDVGLTWNIMQYDTLMISPGGDTVSLSLDWSGEITDHGTITVPGGSFAGSYEIRHLMTFELVMGDSSVAFENESRFWAAPGVGPIRFFQLPTAGPGDPQLGTLEEMTDYSTPVRPLGPPVQPLSFTLGQPFPNPFNATTAVTFALPHEAAIRLQLFDASGRLVRQLINGELASGQHIIRVDAGGLSSGVYFLRLNSDDNSAASRMILLK